MSTARQRRGANLSIRLPQFGVCTGACLLQCALLTGFGIVGCSPQESAAETGLTAPTQPVAREPGEPLKSRSAPRAIKKKDVSAGPYTLPFEPRSNPFEPPDRSVSVQANVAEAMPVADIRLMGLMRDHQGMLAALEVSGNRQLVRAGAQLVSPERSTGIYVRDIRESEVIVEKGGRRWAVALPRWSAVRTTKPSRGKDRGKALSQR